MKKLLLSLTISAAALTASAQTSPVKFGVKAGLTFPTMSFSESVGADIKANTSFYVGGTVDIPVSEIFTIQPGLTFLNKGFKIDESMSLEEMSVSAVAKTGIQYLELPVNALANFPLGDGKLFLGAGPYYAMALSGKVKTEVKGSMDGESASESGSEKIEFGKDGDLKRGDFGVNFLGGYQLSNGFNIHAGYGLGLSNISNDSDSKTKNRVLSVGVGYSF